MKQISTGIVKSLTSYYQKYPWLFYLISSGIYVVLFFAFINKINYDMTHFYVPWYDTIKSGGFSSLRGDFYNYAPTYMYLLAFSTLFPLKPMIAIKLLALLTIPLAGMFMARLVKNIRREPIWCWVGYTITLFTPTVLINASYWGQADIYYSTAVLACISYILDRKPYAAMIAIGIALSFKAQAVLIGPFLLVMLITKRLPWRSIFIPPVIFGLSMLPVILVGKPIGDAFGVYINQANTYHSLCMNCSSIWAPFAEMIDYDLGVNLGMTITLIGAALYVVILSRKLKNGNNESLVIAAVLSVFLMAYLLPKMLDRYFYSAELLSIGLLLIDWRGFLAYILLQLSTSNLYWQALRNQGLLFPLKDSTIINLHVLLLLIWLFHRATTSHLSDRTECPPGQMISGS